MIIESIYGRAALVEHEDHAELAVRTDKFKVGKEYTLNGRKMVVVSAAASVYQPGVYVVKLAYGE